MFPLRLIAFVVSVALGTRAISMQSQVQAADTSRVTESRVVVPENTLIEVRTYQSLSTKRSKKGHAILFAVSEDVVVHQVMVIPRGATVHGQVVEDKKGGIFGGHPKLTIELVSLDLGGENYPLYAYQLKVEGASKTKPTVMHVEEGAVVGGLAGAVVSRSTGEYTSSSQAEDIGGGAAAGAGAVVAVSAVKPRPVVKIPAESEMDFYLAAPISVQPVSAMEAKRLAQRVSPGGAVLYIRGETPDE